MTLKEKNIIKLMVQELASDEGGASEVAEIAESHRSQVSRWIRGQVPSKENQEKVLALYHIRKVLEDVFAKETADKWLFGLNAHLGNRRPIDLLRDRRVAEVLAAIEQDRSGSYA